jgi:hypothetical protein
VVLLLARSARQGGRGSSERRRLLTVSDHIGAKGVLAYIGMTVTYDAA